jgi:hypothetical protein
MDGHDGLMREVNGQEQDSAGYERPSVRELGTVEDLTWDASTFEVST